MRLLDVSSRAEGVRIYIGGESQVVPFEELRSSPPLRGGRPGGGHAGRHRPHAHGLRPHDPDRRHHGAPVCGPYEVTLYEFGSLYYRNGQGQRVGIDPEVLEEVARRTGCVFHTRLDSRVRTWALMAANRLDMTVSGVPTPERLLFGEFVPYLSTRNHLIVRRELASRIASLQAFEADASLRVAVVKSFRHGVTLDRWLERLRAAGRVDEYPDAEVVARVFAAGRADAFLAQPITLVRAADS
jgi:polar amino acid transport system substrate-binding protein